MLTSLGLDDRPLQRMAWLMGGLIGFGVSLALIVVANIGLPPWDVFHQGLSNQVGWSLGTSVIITSGFVLLLWIPIRERPGVGTIANAIVVGLTLDATLAVLPDEIESMAGRIALLIAGIVINGVTTGLYIGAGLGPGPRDGLMTGVAKRGPSIRLVRTVIEVTVLGIGIVLGGTVGIGTLAFAILIGPLAQLFIPKLRISPKPVDAQLA